MTTDDENAREINALKTSVRALFKNSTTLESANGTGLDKNAAIAEISKLLEDSAPELAKEIVERAQASSAAQDTAELNAVDHSALEVIVKTFGRPAIRFHYDTPAMPNNKLGENSNWHTLASAQGDLINEAAVSVGRIGFRSDEIIPVYGTGWRAKDDLIVTNRHVAEHLASNPGDAPKLWKLDPAKSPFIDFSFTDPDPRPSATFDIAEIVCCADFDDIDLAILRMTPGAKEFPPPLPIDWEGKSLGKRTGTVFKRIEVYTLGHPYRQDKITHTVSVYDNADGRKRWSPGYVTGIEDFEVLHDCSTLTGNSGSCVLTTKTNPHSVVGLHHGGNEHEGMKGSGLGYTNRAVAFALLDEKHPAVRLLK